MTPNEEACHVLQGLSEDLRCTRARPGAANHAVHLASLVKRIEECRHQVDESPQEVIDAAFAMFVEVDLVNQQIDAEEQGPSDGS